VLQNKNSLEDLSDRRLYW